MNEQIPEATERRFALRYRVVLAGALLVVSFLFCRAIIAADEDVYSIDAETVAIRAALAQYKTEFGSFPTGDTPAICRALTGANPKSIRFIELRSDAPDGGFLDPWGTPYQIYYSGDSPLVRSAGPNKQFDLSTKRKRTDDYFGG